MFPSVSSLQNPAVADIYTEHAHQVVVAKYAPSGFYVASGGTCARTDARGGAREASRPQWALGLGRVGWREVEM